MDRVGRPALCVETSGGRGRGAALGGLLGAPRLPRPHSAAQEEAFGGEAWLGGTSGRRPIRRLRGLGFEAEGGMAGLSGSGWEEAVGGGDEPAHPGERAGGRRPH